MIYKEIVIKHYDGLKAKAAARFCSSCKSIRIPDFN